MSEVIKQNQLDWQNEETTTMLPEASERPVVAELLASPQSTTAYSGLTYVENNEQIPEKTRKLQENVRVFKNLMMESSQELNQLATKLMRLVDDLKSYEQKCKRY